MLSRRLRMFLAASFLFILVLYLYHTVYFTSGQSISRVDLPGFDAKGHSDASPPLNPLTTVEESISSVSKAITSSTLAPTTTTSTPVSTTSTGQPADELVQASISPNDVLLIFKTGADTIWRRMPLHLTTTLANSRVPNFVVYSDLKEQLSTNVSSIDILENEISIIQKIDPSAHKSYLELQSSSHVNTYREHAGLPGDEVTREAESTTPPGWRLDRYKFLPMLRHAQINWPDLKWYIYIEDDTFIFWHNILRYLSNLSPDISPSYYGAYSGTPTNSFAQGGSGIVFSRSLMRSIFAGSDPPGLERFGNETSQSCCGDIMLGNVLRSHGLKVNQGTYGSPSFKPEPAWKTGFDEKMWCMPIFTLHHVHGRDLVVLSELEKRYEEKDAGRPILFRDIFMELVYPHIQQPMVKNWDNLASKYILGSNYSFDAPSDLGPYDSQAFDQASKSPEACQNACLALPACISWRHTAAAEQNICALDTIMKLGRETDPLPKWKKEELLTSGWILDRVESLLVNEMCNVVKDPDLISHVIFKA